MTSNRFGVGAGLGLTWMTDPPEPGEPLDRDEALNLLAALTLVTGITPEELDGAVRALREGPDAGPTAPSQRALERRSRAEAEAAAHLENLGASKP
jgi:hypothetical protein